MKRTYINNSRINITRKCVVVTVVAILFVVVVALIVVVCMYYDCCRGYCDVVSTCRTNSNDSCLFAV